MKRKTDLEFRDRTLVPLIPFMLEPWDERHLCDKRIHAFFLNEIHVQMVIQMSPSNKIDLSVEAKVPR